jgi:MoaA/NifB/PqqE/SkfB family radical SAM enzyme
MVNLRKRKVERAWKTLQRGRREPALLRTVLRESYRTTAGIAFDKAWRAGRSALPSVLNLELTRRCNLRCRMCPQLRHVAEVPPELEWYDPGRELPPQAWIEVLDQAVRFRPRLYVTGGEPLLYGGIETLLREAKRRRLFVELQTNGTRLSQVAELLVACGVEIVTLSLDGPPDVHDAIRGVPGTFERLAQGVQAIRAASTRQGRPGPFLRGVGVITKQNLAALDELAAAAAALGLDSLRCEHPIIDTPENTARHNAALTPGFARAHGLPLVAPSVMEGEYYANELTAEDLPLLSEKLDRARQRAGEMPFAVLPELSGEALAGYYFDMDYPFSQTCNALWKVCKIASDGSVLPCLHLIMGHVTRQSIEEIWNGAPMVSFRKLILRGLFPGCARCCRRSFKIEDRRTGRDKGPRADTRRRPHA